MLGIHQQSEEYATQKNKDMSKKSYYLKPIVKR